jgi:hypothetical protein
MQSDNVLVTLMRPTKSHLIRREIKGATDTERHLSGLVIRRNSLLCHLNAYNFRSPLTFMFARAVHKLCISKQH